MNQEKLKELLTQGLSMREIAVILECSLTNVRYWVKKLELKSNFKSFKDQERKLYKEQDLKNCPKCGILKSLEDFYTRRDGTHPSVYCKICTNIYSKERQKLFKRKCVEYKGGKCVICDYNKCIAALEFHHLVPTEKDFTIAHSWTSGFNDKIKKELDKCILLCANCHREVHSNSDLGEIQTPN